MKQPMIFLTPVIAGAVLAAFAGVAEAQNSGGRWRLPSQTAVRSGVERPPPPPPPTVIVVAPRTLFLQPVVGLPHLLPCTSFPVASRVIASNGVVLSRSGPPTYTQPVPDEETASQQMLPSARLASRNHQTVLISGVTRAVCYGRDAAGHVYFYP